MLGAKLTGSEVKYIQALSGVSLADPGSSTAFDAAGFSFATMLVASDSADFTANLQRSGTSNGTFGNWGASVPGTASGLSVRSFVLTGSPTWYSVAYDQNGAGSSVSTIIVALQGAYHTPINQDSSTTVYSNVLTN